MEKIVQDGRGKSNDSKRKKVKRRIPRCMKAKGNIPNEGKTRISQGQRE